nr:recombination endonuclease sunbunit [uncultured Mediterranean phage uvMED]BAR29530.1 recombination endonuclease sunbunit [uncultured Mediterranean phage uvMED]
MILFQKIRWKNLLSTGDTFTEVQITGAATNLIIGTNGAGKSTILDAFTFGLFGKPFRKVNKPQLVNSVNEKGTLVEIEFSIGRKEYKIIRGIKPNIFEIYVDGKMLDQNSNAVDQQRNLEQNVLKLNYKSFTQIVVLGSSTFVPFMRLPLPARREIIEDLLDINVFSSMNEVLKVRLKQIRDSVQTHNLNAQSVKEKIELQKGFIQQLEEKKTKDIEQKKDQLRDIIKSQDSCKEKIADATKMIEEITQQIDSLNNPQKRRADLESLSMKLQRRVSKLSGDKRFYLDTEHCPTCKQPISEDFKFEQIEQLDGKIGEIEVAFADIDQRLTEIISPLEQLTEYTNAIRDCTQITYKQQGVISTLDGQRKGLQREIKGLVSDESSVKEEAKKLLQMNESLKQVTGDLIESKKQMDLHSTAGLLLKDSGIKTRIIKKYLPVMNKLINKYLNQLQFFCNFTLDEEFKEVLKSRYIDEFSYENFSEGEKARIDISLLLTWRSVAKLKNSVDTNLLILDEIFDGSLDTVGSDELSFILRSFNENANVFVISHRDNLTDKFDRVLQFTKPQNFSKLEVQESPHSIAVV